MGLKQIIAAALMATTLGAGGCDCEEPDDNVICCNPNMCHEGYHCEEWYGESAHCTPNSSGKVYCCKCLQNMCSADGIYDDTDQQSE
jgi:hypothetical protein